jgi:hypothetical protein
MNIIVRDRYECFREFFFSVRVSFFPLREKIDYPVFPIFLDAV